MKHRILFLYSGLGILLASFVCRWIGMPACCFWLLLGIAIILKTLFLVFTFKEKGFKPKLWLHFILSGVVLILFSLLFKTIIPIPTVYKVLFYSAITLKVTGLLLMIFYRRK